MRWLDSMTDSINMNLSKRQGDSEGQRNLAGCIPQSHKESGTATEQQFNNWYKIFQLVCFHLFVFLSWCSFHHTLSEGSVPVPEKARAPHSSTLAWKIPWTEEPGRLQSMGSLRVGHDQSTSLSLFTSCIGEGNGNPLQCSCLENPRDGGAWWAAVYGVAQSQTWLKRLSSSSVSVHL